MKSMLIIDTPECCDNCALMFEVGYACSCGAGFFKVDIEEYSEKQTKPEWCPLSPLPLKKDLTHYIQRGDTQSMTHLVQYIHDQGYNDCLDEILKEAD